MTELLSTAQMRAIEAQAIESGLVSGIDLMEQAGQGVLDAVFARRPELKDSPGRALVLCGPGNNGGDGFVIARLLVRLGWSLHVFFYGDAEKLPPDARINHHRWAEIGAVQVWDAKAIVDIPKPDLIVDAVFGIGLTRPLPDQVSAVLDAAFLTRWSSGTDIYKVAVDCPSGLNLDTGFVPDLPEKPARQRLNRADLTVTFHSPKPGHYLAMGPTLCGALAIVPLALGRFGQERAMMMGPPDPERARLIEPRFNQKPLLNWPLGHIGKSKMGGHKYSHGHVVVFAGGSGQGGAARLAARAALRAGAGLVTIACAADALIENASALDAVMLRVVSETSAAQVLSDDRITGFCLGPGMGISMATRNRVLEVLAQRSDLHRTRDPVVVLDADALTVFADNPKDLFNAVHARTILTPHEGEFARLFPDLAQSSRGQLSKIDVVRKAAIRAGCVVLLKGEDTVVANPDGAASLHGASYDRTAPWLATAGAGDVLAGLIAGLAASDVSGDLINMAEVAVWLHVECARSFGPGLIAEDLAQELPKVLRRLSD
ncbi:MAG: NAD(P)H-hydrate dehydratase [Roseobacter sp.]